MINCVRSRYTIHQIKRIAAVLVIAAEAASAAVVVVVVVLAIPANDYQQDLLFILSPETRTRSSTSVNQKAH